jgi:hypothetical protein
MLHEIKKTQQDSSFEGHRRWFSDENFDLIVWLSPHEEIIGFQLCYDLQARERSLMWSKGRGFTQGNIDTGETDPTVNRSPLFVAGGPIAAEQILKTFEPAARGIDSNISGFIIARLREAAQTKA